jgi:putative transposase
LTKRLVERALAVELTEHMGQERYESVANATANTCNGKNKKTAHLFHGSTVLNLSLIHI